MHRAALALGASGGLAVKFGHAFVHAHADGEGVAVVAVGRDDVVVVAHEGGRAHRDGLLAIIEMEKTAHLARVVNLGRLQFEAPDANHAAEKPELVLLRERGVDRRCGEINRGGGGFWHAWW